VNVLPGVQFEHGFTSGPNLCARYGRGIGPDHCRYLYSLYLLISYLWLEARMTSFVGMSKVFMVLDLDVIILSASLAAPVPRP